MHSYNFLNLRNNRKTPEFVFKLCLTQLNTIMFNCGEGGVGKRHELGGQRVLRRAVEWRASEVDRHAKKEAGTGEHLTHLIIK